MRAARREPVERTPVWFMRQAGRSLPEYRAIREQHGFFGVNRSAELTAEVTLQPVRRHGVDAAVMFADIMTPVHGMGIDVELVEGVGPVVRDPIRTLAAVEQLRVPDPAEAFAPLLEAIRIVRSELDAEQAVVGFCGGPFTVAGYLVEGKPSRDYTKVKALMYRAPEQWHALMATLAECFARYVQEQVAAGADVIQLFDSWVGVLSPTDYREFVAPHSERVLAAVDVPTIHFGTGTTHLLELRAVAGDREPRVVRREDEADDDVRAGRQGRPDSVCNAGRPVLHAREHRHGELTLERGARVLRDRVQRVVLLHPEAAIARDEVVEVLRRDRPSAADVRVVRGHVVEPLGRAVRHQHDRRFHTGASTLCTSSLNRVMVSGSVSGNTP